MDKKSLNIVTFCRVHEKAKLPNKTRPEDAGYDIFWCPQKDEEWVYINPNESKLFPTGLRSFFPEDYVLEIKNRSGNASKGLIVGACIVDSSYSGEIYVNLHNISNRVIKLSPGDKIAQFLIYKVESPAISIVTEEVFEKLHENSTRKSGGFGSTGNT